MKLGSHVSNSGKDMLAGSVAEAHSYGANCFMIYLGAPQNTFRKRTNELNIEEMHRLMQEYGMETKDIIIHAPYIVNLAQPDPVKRHFAIDFLASEASKTYAVGAKIMVIHPGAHMGEGSTEGIKRIARGVNDIIEATKDTDVIIALETMAGKGSECGVNFLEIREMIDQIEDKTRIGVCLDTCHINDAGYDIVNNYEQVIEDFDKTIGLEYLKVIHVNDSKNPISSHKDRHENIGFGKIGFDAIMRFINDERFQNIPMILETPYVAEDEKSEDSYPPYKFEIEMIKAGKFNPNLLTDVLGYYKNL